MPLQNPNKLEKNPAGGPPKAGLIWNPTTRRWARPRSGTPGLHSPINPRLLQGMSDKELTQLKSQTRESLQKERNQERFNDLTRVLRQTVEESKRRQVHKALTLATKLSKRLAAQEVLDGTTVLLKGLSLESAIPLEQIKGDLARAGHVVKSIIALDPESRRIFFTDGENVALYCSFSGPDQGFAVSKIGYQADISKEYDPVDLEADDDEETVITTHEERDGNITPGLLPSGTPGEKPENDEDSYEAAGQFGEGLGDEGFGTDSRHTGRRDELKALMTKVEKQLEKAGPPRPGLVPESGDPLHPKRWVRPPATMGPGKPGYPDVAKPEDEEEFDWENYQGGASGPKPMPKKSPEERDLLTGRPIKTPAERPQTGEKDLLTGRPISTR